MGETGSETLRKFEVLNRINSAKRGIVETAKAIDWRMDKNARNAREELLRLDPEVEGIDADSLPKVLRLVAGDDEYISIRRQEGRSLYTEKDVNNNPFGCKSIFGVDPKIFPNGSIGFLVIPITATCVNKDLEKILRKDESYWIDSDFENFIFDGSLSYQSGDWELIYRKVLFKHVGDRFYKLQHYPEDKFDKKSGIISIKPVDGRLPLYVDERYYTDKDLQIKRNWYNQNARLYVLLKGSSDSEKTGVPVTRLVQQKVGAS